MDKQTERKLNLLVHLANIDGIFHKSEKALIKEFLSEKGINPIDFEFIRAENEKLQDLHLIDDKNEIMFLALKLIQADKIIDRREVAFYKKLADKLGFKPELIDFFANITLERELFDQLITEWRL